MSITYEHNITQRFSVLREAKRIQRETSPAQLLLLSWGLQDTFLFGGAFVTFHSAWEYLHRAIATARKQTKAVVQFTIHK